MQRILALSFATLQAVSTIAAAAQPEIGKAVVVKNAVAIEGKAAKPLSTGSSFRQGEVIVTGASSGAEVELIDNTKLAVGPEARFEALKFVYDPTASGGTIALSLSRGAFRFITGAAAKESYEIKTPTASLGIKGTVFDAYIADDGGTAVLVHEGSVNICNAVHTCQLLAQGRQIVFVSSEGILSVHSRWESSIMPGTSARTAFPFLGARLTIDPVQRFSPDELTPAAVSEPQQQAAGGGNLLANIQGTVLLNRGQGFQPVSINTPVEAGDRVRAVNGSANIVYGNGAAIPVAAGQTAVVLSDPPAPPAPPAAAGLADISTPLLVAGGAGLAGLGAAIIVESQSSKSKPASP